MRCSILLILVWAFCAKGLFGNVVLVEEGQPRATIIVPAHLGSETQKALEELQQYLLKISGTELPYTNDLESVATPNRLWLGVRPEIDSHIQGLELEQLRSEETVIAAQGNDLVIAGRDVSYGENQTEAGTRLAVYSFLQEDLGVVWLWPGKLGEDYIEQSTIAIPTGERRYTPQIRSRRMRMIEPQRTQQKMLELRSQISGLKDIFDQKSAEVALWANRQRIDAGPIMQTSSAMRGGFRFEAGHAYSAWYQRYHKQFPGLFALQPDGSRSGYPGPKYAKLCVSNPQVVEFWLKDAAQRLYSNPWDNVIQASENDMGWQGYCVCENCLALDVKEGPLLDSPLRWEGVTQRHYSLTDRYVHYWNQLAENLKKQYPDRDLYVGVYAYQANAQPPVKRTLHENVAVGYVGMWSRNPGINTLKRITDHKEQWRKWSEKASMLVWRPNMMIHRFHMGVPYVFPRRTGELFNFLAEHKIVGFDLDNISCDWANQGPQYYVLAQLIWNPRANVEELLENYYSRGFGPAAEYVAAYYDLFEQTYYQHNEKQNNWYFGSLPEIYREYQLIEKGEALLKQASDVLQQAPDKYKERLDMVRTGFLQAQAMVAIIEAKNNLDASTGTNKQTVEQAFLQAAEQIEKLYLAHLGSHAVNYSSYIGTMAVRQLLPEIRTQAIEAVPDDEG